ncbi:hypothetical protein BSP2_38400 [Bacillus subtilis subsp. subtilis]|nr:hypothetical protein BSP2_38400 [Bacillus subtilis subsp. subtilis]
MIFGKFKSKLFLTYSSIFSIITPFPYPHHFFYFSLTAIALITFHFFFSQLQFLLHPYLYLRQKEKQAIVIMINYSGSLLKFTYCFLNVLKYDSNHPNQSLERIALEVLENRVQAHLQAFRQLHAAFHLFLGLHLSKFG